jgi:hypothetical protein
LKALPKKSEECKVALGLILAFGKREREANKDLHGGRGLRDGPKGLCCLWTEGKRRILRNLAGSMEQGSRKLELRLAVVAHACNPSY